MSAREVVENIIWTFSLGQLIQQMMPHKTFLRFQVFLLDFFKNCFLLFISLCFILFFNASACFLLYI